MELKIKKLSKQFKDKTAVDDVSLTLTPGIWGLLGANGAGKTTLMRMLAGILKPAKGEIFYNGKDIHTMGETYRDRLGYLPQEFGFFHDFTVKDYLEYVAALKDIPREETGDRIDHLLHTLTLREVKNKKIIKLSGGMKRRVGIAQAMLNNPEILIMDEPTAGLDPGERVRFRNLISEFSQERIVLISTHIVSDIEYIATQNAIMKSGKILAAGKTEQLEQLADGKVWSCLVPAEKMPLYEMQLRIINRRSEGNNRVAIRYLSEEKKISDSVTVPPSLEDLYLWLFPEENINEGGR